MTITLLEIPRPEIENMLEGIENLRKRVEAGEFDSIWIIGWTPDHQLISVERGKPVDRLVKIGMIECFKQDMIQCMETGEPSGL
jgi:hypothetical protein